MPLPLWRASGPPSIIMHFRILICENWHQYAKTVENDYQHKIFKAKYFLAIF